VRHVETSKKQKIPENTQTSHHNKLTTVQAASNLKPRYLAISENAINTGK